MSNRKPSIPLCPSMPGEDEIEEDLRNVEEGDTPLLNDEAKVLLESVGGEIIKNDTQETAQKLVDNVDELEETISALDKKYNDLVTCEKDLKLLEEEIDKQINEIYVAEINSNPTVK
ncbi:uncharacterized protein LOC126903476 isoform X2 [Daktulosphaira vitifoliae]|uniref:uncharacterized protein LOC126903476 isoform X2 n=1 Tax=Daktulosphaira vitifoliae TaxID=58002 RepID=UPI0021A9D93C|nr:uncharacterized protein LOC126903476 isoform X2 [Daktulosphaira vitifoliae]